MARRWVPRRLYKCAASAGALSMCHALRARASSVMAARVRLKMQCGTVMLLLVVIIVVCGVDLVCGMFEDRQCNHQHPRPHEVSVTKRTTLLLFSSYSLLLSFHLCCPRSLGRRTRTKQLDWLPVLVVSPTSFFPNFF